MPHVRLLLTPFQIHLRRIWTHPDLQQLFVCKLGLLSYIRQLLSYKARALMKSALCILIGETGISLPPGKTGIYRVGLTFFTSPKFMQNSGTLHFNLTTTSTLNYLALSRHQNSLPLIHKCTALLGNQAGLPIGAVCPVGKWHSLCFLIVAGNIFISFHHHCP